jgi:hypothetical protein
VCLDKADAVIDALPAFVAAVYDRRPRFVKFSALIERRYSELYTGDGSCLLPEFLNLVGDAVRMEPSVELRARVLKYFAHLGESLGVRPSGQVLDESL